MKPLLLTLLLVSCSYFERSNESKDNAASYDVSSLESVGNLYCDLSRPKYLELGYVHSKCDGSGFTSLYSVRCKDVDLSVFNGEDWKLYRSPTKDCLSEGESLSESSRDMVIMRMVAAYVLKDKEWVENFYNFAKKNSLKICKSDGSLDGLSRCVLSLDLFQTLGEMRLAKSGFEAHLYALKVWLKGKVYGGVSDKELSELKELAEKEPNNALFQAVYHRYLDGDMSRVYELLNYWPKDRLPNSSDHCEEYLWQRDEKDNLDWLPCEPLVDHSGTDYNLAFYIAEEK